MEVNFYLTLVGNIAMTFSDRKNCIFPPVFRKSKLPKESEFPGSWVWRLNHQKGNYMAGLPCRIDPFPTLKAVFLNSDYTNLPFLLLPNTCY